MFSLVTPELACEPFFLKVDSPLLTHGCPLLNKLIVLLIREYIDISIHSIVSHQGVRRLTLSAPLFHWKLTTAGTACSSVFIFQGTLGLPCVNLFLMCNCTSLQCDEFNV